MVKVRCGICERNFKDENGLEQHNAAIHGSSEVVKKGPGSRKLRNWIIFSAILIVIVGLIGWAASFAIEDMMGCKTDPVSEIDIGGHQNLALHIHTDLKILIDGVERVIPGNIGVLPGVMRPLHTHDQGGNIHIEGACPREFKVGEFFEIWGEEFNSRCILGNCVESGELKFYVDEKENSEYEDYVMRDTDRVRIEFISFS